ncbi:MAG: hypothetical protein ACE5IK_03215 [Acidobacteriota bacterium]
MIGPVQDSTKPPAVAGAPRFRRLGLVVGVNAGLIGACLVVLELLLAANAPSLPPNGEQPDGLYTWGHLVQVNRLGFRGREFEVPKPRDVYRVMVLGDSLTWGAGLSVGERYTDIAEKLLNAGHGREDGSAISTTGGAADGRPERGPRFEVLNFGVMGGPTTAERDILRRYADAVDPDLIVVGFCLNDPQPRSQDYSIERARFDRGPGRISRGAARGLAALGLTHVGRLVDEGVHRLAEITGLVPTWQESLDRTYAEDSPEWSAFVAALAEIRAIATRRGLPPPVFAILNQGTFTDRPTDYVHPDSELVIYLRWYHQAEEAARAAGFITYDHQDEIATRLNDESLAVNVTDGHPSAHLNQLYAEKLTAAIVAGRASGVDAALVTSRGASPSPDG